MKLSKLKRFELFDMHIYFEESFILSLDIRNFSCYTVLASKS